MSTTRVGDAVYSQGKLLGLLLKGRWHRHAEGDLVPLEPLLSARDAADLETCVLAAPQAPATDPIADQARARIATLDSLLSPAALAHIRRPSP